MIRKLRKRPQADTQSNDARRTGISWGRHLYLAMLVALFALLFDYLWGDMVALKADGIVLRDGTELAATSMVRVDEVLVRSGQEVEEGDLLLRVGSAAALSAIAEQSARTAALAQRDSEIRAEIRAIEERLPLLRRRALSGDFADRAAVKRLTSERAALSDELDVVQRARESVTDALDDLRAHYSGGEVRAPARGTIGTEVPSRGSVYRAGDPLLTVLSGESYVLAFLPRNYLFNIDRGRRVDVTNGHHTQSGEILEILAVSKSLPPELRTAFRAGDRHQLARVRLDDPAEFPTFANVRIRDVGWSDVLSGAARAAACVADLDLTCSR